MEKETDKESTLENENIDTTDMPDLESEESPAERRKQQGQGLKILTSNHSQTSEPHRFKLDLTDKLNLKNPNKNMALANLSIYYTWKNIKSEYNNNKFKILALTWNDTFDLPDGSYYIADIQDYFEFIIKKFETLTENPPI